MNRKSALVSLLIPVLLIVSIGCTNTTPIRDVDGVIEATPELTQTNVSTSSIDPISPMVPNATSTPTMELLPTATAVTRKATAIAVPDFQLPGISGSTTSLYEMLSLNRFVVLVFYRGYF